MNIKHAINDVAQEILLNQFDPEIRGHLIDYGKRISESQSDINIFMARKSACFYYCLNRLGLASAPPCVTTDRILEHDLSWISGKSISIFDEALITGTTLARTKKTLLEAGAKSVETIVFVANKDWWARDLIQPDGSFLQVDDATCSRVGHAVVKSLSLLPRPYSIDYPLFQRVTISTAELEHLYNIPGWSFCNHTSRTQGEHDAFVWTLEPDNFVENEVWKECGLSLFQKPDLLKIRVYGRKNHKKSETLSFRILPIAITKPLKTKQINQIFSFISKDEASNSFEALRKSCTTEISKLRVIQYYISDKLAKYWIKYLCKQINRNIEFLHDDEEISLLFPPYLSKQIKSILNPTDKQLQPEHIYQTKTNKQRLSTSQKLGKNFHLARLDLIRPFQEKYKSEEIPARKLALKYGTAILNMTDPVLKRLNEGFSIQQLYQKIQYPYETKKRVLSSFLDFAIDSGLVVPITSEHTELGGEKIIYRAFRHGEEIHLDERATKIFDTMLREFYSTITMSRIERTRFEKVLVLMLKGAIKSNLITEWTAARGAEHTVGIRYFLHGAVMQLEQSSLVDYNPDRTFVSYLENHGVIETAKRGPIRLKDTPLQTKLSTSEIAKAQQIGRALALGIDSLNAITKDKRQITDQLVFLATCLGERAASLAIAAELKYFSRNWLNNREKIRPLSIEKNTPTDPDVFPTENCWVALDSALKKWRAYEQNTPINLLNEIPKKIDRSDQFTWHDLWPAEKPPETTDFIEESKIRMSQGAIISNRILALMGIWAYIRRNNGTKPINEKLTNKSALIETILDCIDFEKKYNKSSAIEEIFMEIKNNSGFSADELTPEGKALFIIGELDKASQEAQSISASIVEDCRQHGKAAQIWNYPTAITISVLSNTGNQKRFDDSVERIRVASSNAVSHAAHSLPSSNRGNLIQIDKQAAEPRLFLVPLERFESKHLEEHFLLVGRGEITQWMVKIIEKVIQNNESDLIIRSQVFFGLSGDEKFSANEHSGHPQSTGFKTIFENILQELSSDPLSTITLINCGNGGASLSALERALKVQFDDNNKWTWTSREIGEPNSPRIFKSRQLRLPQKRHHETDNHKPIYLFFASRPDGHKSSEIRTDLELEKLENILNNEESMFKLISIHGTTTEKLTHALTNTPATFLHFSGHFDNFITLETTNQLPFTLTPQGFSHLIKIHKSIKCLILSGCNTYNFGLELSKKLNIPHIITTTKEITDENANTFASVFGSLLAKSKNALDEIVDIFDCANISVDGQPYNLVNKQD